jgi:orotidine-5'-phosphate decarboxylase
MVQHFADRLADVVRGRKTCLCVGLDPRWELLPTAIRSRHDSSLEGRAAAYEAFCLLVLDLVAPHCGVVKPQSAFFEACGPAGFLAQRNILRRAREMGLITILDAKRGDIASTAEAYADAAFGDVWNADALTVNPYLGRDAVDPFVNAARRDCRGLFVLVRTSNSGAGLFQDLSCDGRRLYEVVGDEVGRWSGDNLGQCGFGDVGAVVGATHRNELKALRERLPHVWFLVPGYGAQGGSAADARAAMRGDGLGAIVNSSRGVTFPFHPEDTDWEAKVTTAAVKSATELSIS